MRIAACLGILLLAATASAAPVAKRTKSQAPKVVEDDEDEEASEEADAKHDHKRKADADEGREDEEGEDVAEEAPAIVRTAPKPRAKRELYFRAGIAHVDARTKSSGMELEPAGITKLMPTTPPQGEIVTDPVNVVVAILGFAPATFRGYLAFETMIGIPKKSKLRATGDLANMSLAPTALDLIPTGVPALGEEIGETSAAPLMLTAVARTPELGGRVRAYVGVGPSVLFVRGAKVTNKVLTEVATPKIEVTPALGVVAHAGLDLKLYKQFYARLDIKEMWFQPSETRISNIRVKTTIPLLETVEVGSAKSRVQANPLIVQFGIGASF